MIETKNELVASIGGESFKRLYPLPTDYQHIGAGSFHYKIHLIEDCARAMNAGGFHSRRSICQHYLYLILFIFNTIYLHWWIDVWAVKQESIGVVQTDASRK